MYNGMHFAEQAFSLQFNVLASILLHSGWHTFGVGPHARTARVSPGGRIGENEMSPKNRVVCKNNIKTSKNALRMAEIEVYIKQSRIKLLTLI